MCFNAQGNDKELNMVTLNERGDAAYPEGRVSISTMEEGSNWSPVTHMTADETNKYITELAESGCLLIN